VAPVTLRSRTTAAFSPSSSHRSARSSRGSTANGAPAQKGLGPPVATDGIMRTRGPPRGCLGPAAPSSSRRHGQDHHRRGAHA
jgi:hypothetical protein